MPVNLIAAAANWEPKPKKVECTFTVLADEVILGAKDRSKQILPSGTKHVRIVATPTPKPNGYWETMVALVVASDGTVSPDAGFAPWVAVTQASSATAGATLATVKVSRFRDVTAKVRDLLKVVPGTPGPGQTRPGGAPTQPDLARNYGKWPPDNLDIDPLPAAHFLDVANPVKTGGILSFVKSSVAVDAESIVVELAGVPAPQLFGVVWPDAVVRNNGAAPTRFFFYFRQSGGQDSENVFVGGGVKGSYPYNFDYAERCLFESQHYPGTPIIVRTDWMLRPKGVPYQVARSGARVVTVFPVADVNDKISYGVLSNFDEMGRLLAELQAYMFWKVGIVAPPTTVGATALSGFSSVNYWLAHWLYRNRKSKFLENNISAVYFLDPPNVAGCVDAGLRWRERMGTDKRVRLYSAKVYDKYGRIDETHYFSAYRRLLYLEPKDPLVIPRDPQGHVLPYLLSAADNKITMALFPTDSWNRTFKDVLGQDAFKAVPLKDKAGNDREWENWDAHHLVPSTVLTHALAQGDL
jgi:hypothetical protein